jgi:hypothetical protein
MKVRRVLLALAFAVAAGVGVSASPPPAAAAINLPAYSCQTINVYTLYATPFRYLSEYWQLEIVETASGCWRWSNNTTWATGHSTRVIYFNAAWVNDANYEGYAYGSAWYQALAPSAMGGDPTVYRVYTRVTATEMFCVIGCSSPPPGNYIASQVVLLYPTLAGIVPGNGGWYVNTGCYLQSGTNVSGGCSAQWTTVGYGAVVNYY